MKVMFSVVAALALTVSVYAKDHAAEYQAGTFSSTGQLSDGSIAQCAGHFCSTRGASHNIHYVRTTEGMYIVQAPISVAGSLIVIYATAGVGPMVHKEWFMDELHAGDKILFRVKCNKHYDCEMWLPNPDKPGTEYRTMANFQPDHAKTNTSALCGTGKLVAAVEAEVCPATTTITLPAPTPAPVAVPAPVSVASVTPTTPAPPAAAAQVPATPAPAAVPGYLPTPPLYADPKKQ